jgi:hypothetical protein
MQIRNQLKVGSGSRFSSEKKHSGSATMIVSKWRYVCQLMEAGGRNVCTSMRVYTTVTEAPMLNKPDIPKKKRTSTIE